MTTPLTTQEDSGRGRRKLRNYLLDQRLQLKFVAYFVALTLVVAAVLGVFLLITTDTLFHEMNGAVDARSKAAETNRELATCSLNNELARNLDNPAFTAQLAERSGAIERAFEAEKQAVLGQRAELVERQRATMRILVALLAGFVVLVALGAILITHRIVGPLFRIKRMAKDVAAGRLRPPDDGLRPSDDLQEVFGLFATMIRTLREQTQAAYDALEGGDAAAVERLRRELKARLDRE